MMIDEIINNTVKKKGFQDIFSTIAKLKKEIPTEIK